jgi:hypothetical protein
MNKLDKQTDLIGESYKNYLTITEPTFMGKNISLPEYIHWVKTDEKYSEKWGLKIEERELSYSERSEISQVKRINWEDSSEEDLIINHTNAMNLWNVPTKLITIIYNNETIESYE